MNPDPEWHLRVMSPADYDDVIALWRACEGIGLSAADERDAIATYLDRNPAMSFVAVAGGAGRRSAGRAQSHRHPEMQPLPD